MKCNVLAEFGATNLGLKTPQRHDLDDESLHRDFAHFPRHPCYSEFVLEFFFSSYQILSLLRTIGWIHYYLSQYTENLMGWKKNDFEHKFTRTRILARKTGEITIFNPEMNQP